MMNVWIRFFVITFACLLIATSGVDSRKKIEVKRQAGGGSVAFDDTSGERCTDSQTGQSGTCTPVTRCLNAFQFGIGRTPDICWWNGEEPVVCCVDETTASITDTEDTSAVCGMRPPSTSVSISSARRIFKRRVIGTAVVGGREVNPHTWPWMGAIFIQRSPTVQSRFLCGASLISKRYVLTAAHCFGSKADALNTSMYSVVLGVHIARGTGIDGSRFGVENIKLHENYQQGLHYNDIALVRLSSDVIYIPQIKPVCLPAPAPPKLNLTGQQCVVTGWGDLQFGGVSSKVLQEVSVPVISDSECNRSYATVGRSAFPNGVDDSVLCAGLQEGGKDACQGDSGGPLVTNFNGARWTQVGIVSFGYGCAMPGYPGVYTRLDYFMKWIQENAGIR